MGNLLSLFEIRRELTSVSLKFCREFLLPQCRSFTARLFMPSGRELTRMPRCNSFTHDESESVLVCSSVRTLSQSLSKDHHPRILLPASLPGVQASWHAEQRRNKHVGCKDIGDQSLLSPNNLGCRLPGLVSLQALSNLLYFVCCSFLSINSDAHLENSINKFKHT